MGGLCDTRSGMWHYQALSRLSCFGGFVLMKLKWWRAQQLRFGVNSSLLRSLFSNSPCSLPYIILTYDDGSEFGFGSTDNALINTNSPCTLDHTSAHKLSWSHKPSSCIADIMQTLLTVPLWTIPMISFF